MMAPIRYFTLYSHVRFHHVRTVSRKRDLTAWQQIRGLHMNNPRLRFASDGIDQEPEAGATDIPNGSQLLRALMEEVPIGC
jgi:hypothetical protein